MSDLLDSLELIRATLGKARKLERRGPKRVVTHRNSHLEEQARLVSGVIAANPVTARKRGSLSRVKIYLAVARLPVAGRGQMKNRLTRQSERRGGELEPDTGDSRWMPVVRGQRQLVRFEIVGPLLIQADIIGGVCYLHTLVPALLVQDRITKKNMENLFGRS